jgi:hypothetical protein
MKKLILLLNISLLLASCTYFFLLTTNETGKFIYPLDDSYIHLAIAKNYALYDTWGISQYKFSSTTSAPLFTYIESILIKCFGINDYYPLIINIVFCLLFIILIHNFFKKENNIAYTLLTLFITWLPLIYIQVLTGMEHMIHIVLILLSLHLLKEYFFHKKVKIFIYLCLVLGISTMIRFESLFFIFPICIIMGLKKEFIKGIGLGIFSLIPVIIYGYISIYNGDFFLPNSLLIKGNTNTENIWEFLLKPIKNICIAPYLIPIILGNLHIIFTNFRNGSRKLINIINTNNIQIITIITILLHITFARFGWLLRYEAYLLTLGVISLIPLINKIIIPKNIKFVKNYRSIIVLLLILSTFSRNIYGAYKMERASINIYEQQIQMSKFINKYFNNSKVIANDIGAISYYSKIDLLDLVGLGSSKIVRIMKNENLDRFSILKSFKINSYIIHNEYEICLIYDTWFNYIPNNFIKVGEWTISNNRICGSQTVTFYAIGKNNVIKLKTALSDFNKLINKNVKVKLLPIQNKRKSISQIK